MSTQEGSQDVHDLIQQARLECSVGAIDDLLTIVTALNDRVLMLNHDLSKAEHRIVQLDRDQIIMAGRMDELERKIASLQIGGWNP